MGKSSRNGLKSSGKEKGLDKLWSSYSGRKSLSKKKEGGCLSCSWTGFILTALSIIILWLCFWLWVVKLQKIIFKGWN